MKITSTTKIGIMSKYSAKLEIIANYIANFNKSMQKSISTYPSMQTGNLDF